MAKGIHHPHPERGGEQYKLREGKGCKNQKTEIEPLCSRPTISRMRADNCPSVPRLLFTSIKESRKEGVQERQKGGRRGRKAGKEGRKGKKGNNRYGDNGVAEGSRLMHVSKVGI